MNGEWGTICDRTFGLEEAHIACRALGYGSAKTVHRQATYGRGIGKIHYYSRLAKSVIKLQQLSQHWDIIREPYIIIIEVWFSWES